MAVDADKDDDDDYDYPCNIERKVRKKKTILSWTKVVLRRASEENCHQVD